MHKTRIVLAAAVAVTLGWVFAFQAGVHSQAGNVSQAVRDFISVQAPVIALEHARVIDGTGAAAVEDQTLIIQDGRIQAVGPAASTTVPAGAKVIDLTGETVLPGLVGMHDHLFYPAPSGVGRIPGAPALYNELGFSFPRLYLASGVTTLRTTGSVAPYADLGIKKEIDEGRIPGPHLHITGPYLEGKGAFTPQMHELTGPEDATRMVNFWADAGATSFKAYMHITRAELAAAVKAAHARGLKVTGHLCSIGFREAAAIGIDDLEHSLEVDTELDPGKQPDVCPPGNVTNETLSHLDLNSAPVQQMIHDLVTRHVAITSTLPVFEISVPGRPPLEPRVLEALSPQSRVDYLFARSRVAEHPGSQTVIFKKEQQFERMFVKAGGTLLAGLDPTGYGGVLAGFGDQREIELLVEAGFTPVEAIHIATENGARFLDLDDRIGTIHAGKAADLVVVHGNPAAHIEDIEQVVTVFKDGVGFDSQKLIDSVRGQVGLH
jgi:imidazolonepropionase-like amidohydrolase